MSWDLAVVLVVITLLAGVVSLWFVLRGDGIPAQARRLADGTQEARIVVDRGYTPSRIELDVDMPTTLRFDRRNDDPCTEMLVSELWPNAHRLVACGETAVRFTPQRTGRFAFTCGMGMYSGELIVRRVGAAHG